VAQAAISRILFSMGRDRKLPAVLAKVHPRYQTPYVSTVLVAVVSLIVSLGFQDHMPLLTNLVNFGALTSFVVLHLSVIVHFTIRQKSRQVVAHLLCPLIGMSVIAYVLTSMDPLAIKAGIAWLALGAVYLFIRSRVFKDKSTTLEL